MVRPASVADVGSRIALALNVTRRRPTGLGGHPESRRSSVPARSGARAERTPPTRLGHNPQGLRASSNIRRANERALSLHRGSAGNRAPYMRTATMNALSTRTQIVILGMIVGRLASSPLTEAGASGSSIGSCLASETEVPLVTCGAIPGGTGTRRFRVRTDCGRDLRVEILGAPAGNYPVLVAGTLRGTMVVGVLGQGEIEFDTSPDAGELLLDFDPAAEVDVNTPGGQLALSQSPDAACVSSSPPPPPTCTPAESLVSLVNSGDLPAATGTRRLRTREDCGQDLSVEVQDATPGKSYVVWVS